VPHFLQKALFTALSSEKRLLWSKELAALSGINAWIGRGIWEIGRTYFCAKSFTKFVAKQYAKNAAAASAKTPYFPLSAKHETSSFFFAPNVR
jgi:hypothetical protein